MANEDSGESGSKPVDAPTARRRQDALGKKLRQLYDEVVSEPVPDELLSFLEQIDSRDPSSDARTSANSAKSDSQKSGPEKSGR